MGIGWNGGLPLWIKIHSYQPNGYTISPKDVEH